MPETQSSGRVASWIDHLGDSERFRLLSAPIAAFIVFLVVIPLAFIVIWSTWEMGQNGLSPAFSLDAYGRLFDTGRVAPLLFTLRTAAAVMLVDLIIAYPVAYFIYRHVAEANKQIFLLLLVIPFVVSRVLRIFSLVFMLSQRGVISQLLFFLPTRVLLYSELSMQIGLVLDTLPLAIFPIWLALERIDPSLFEASSDLGASPRETFQHVVLPLSAPGLAAGGLLVFVVVLGAETIPGTLGGPSVQMIGNVLMEVFSSIDLPLAGAISVMMLSLVVVVLAVFMRTFGFRQLFEGI